MAPGALDDLHPADLRGTTTNNDAYNLQALA